jgi:cytochrome c
MKRLLMLGLAYFLMACNSSSDKKSLPNSTVLRASDSTETIASIDTASASTINPVASENKNSQVKISKVEAINPQVKENQDSPIVKAVENSDILNIKNGEVLISKSDCMACHKVQDKLLGPSYKDIANKYEKNKTNIGYLVQKVKTGGSGVWGPIPMSPHPTLSDDDAHDMIVYILGMK